MSIEVHTDKKPLTRNAPPSWGELVADGQSALVVRFLLEQSVVTIPFVQFKRWEHTFGLPETLTIEIDRYRIVVEGRDLVDIRVALDLGRLCELRVNYTTKVGARPGPQVRRIAFEIA